MDVNAEKPKFCNGRLEEFIHGEGEGMGEAGVASSDTVNGSYEWHGSTRPIDTDGVVRDCTVYKDLDGCAYFIYDRDVKAAGDGTASITYRESLSLEDLKW